MYGHHRHNNRLNDKAYNEHYMHIIVILIYGHNRHNNDAEDDDDHHHEDDDEEDDEDEPCVFGLMVLQSSTVLVGVVDSGI